LDALLAIACAVLSPPGRIGTDGVTNPLSSLTDDLAAVLPTVRLSAIRRRLLASFSKSGDDYVATTASQVGSGGAGEQLGWAGGANGVAGSYPGTVRYATPTSTQSLLNGASAFANTHHHTTFISPASGTGAISLVLLIDLAIGAGLLLWRAARRWIIPR